MPRTRLDKNYTEKRVDDLVRIKAAEKHTSVSKILRDAGVARSSYRYAVDNGTMSVDMAQRIARACRFSRDEVADILLG